MGARQVIIITDDNMLCLWSHLISLYSNSMNAIFRIRCEVTLKWSYFGLPTSSLLSEFAKWFGKLAVVICINIIYTKREKRCDFYMYVLYWIKTKVTYFFNSFIYTKSHYQRVTDRTFFIPTPTRGKPGQGVSRYVIFSRNVKCAMT